VGDDAFGAAHGEGGSGEEDGNGIVGYGGR
jgi:hypothetical protein